MQRFRFALTLLAVLLPSVSTADERIRIGWIGPLGGNSAVLGVDSAPAAELAVAAVNAQGGIGGKRVELLVEDDQHEVKNSLTAYRKLQRMGAVAILMSTYGGFFAAASAAAKDGIVLMNPLDCNESIARLSNNSFCVATLTESISTAIAEDIEKRGFQRVGLVYDEHHPFMVIVADELKKRLPADRLTLAAIDQSSFNDYPALALKLRRAAVGAVVFLGHDPVARGMVEARKNGSTAQFYTVGTITSPGFQKIAGKAADGTLVAYWEAPKTDAVASFLQQFQKKVGRPPILQLASLPSFDATNVLIEAMKRLNGKSSTITGSNLAQELYEIRDYPGLTGDVTIEPDGIVRSITERLYRFDGGTLLPVKQ